MINILEYGAVGDGQTNDAPVIQKAIDTCAEQGGGVVLFPGGRTYSSGYVLLKSNVEVHLEPGAVWKASSNIEDYYPLRNNGKITAHESGLPSFLNSEYAGRPFHAFIYALGQENVTISGQGTIDGNESVFYGDDSGYHIEGSYYPRVPLLLLEDVKHLTIKEVRLTNCAFWTVHLVGCKDVLIDGIRLLNNLKMANSDGIDPDHCQNVRISNCHIECGDDAIVLKNSGDYKKYGPCENIVVTNCTLVSTSAAIKFGTESEAPFRNILVQNCNITRSNRGISLQLRDKGCIENVTFSGLTIDTRQFSPDHWWGKSEPVAITGLRRKEDSSVGYIKNITFRDIHCTSENGILIYGDKTCNIEHVLFENVTLKLTKKTDWPKGIRDLRPCPGNIQEKDKIHSINVCNARDIVFTRFDSTTEENLLSCTGEPCYIKNSQSVSVNGEML